MEFFNTFLKGFNGKISSISSWKHYVLTAQVPKCIRMQLAHKKMENKKSVAPAEDSQQKFIWSPHLTARLFHSHFQA